MKGLTIGQVAKKARVTIHTVRYYERRGLIAEPPRRKSGYRAYPEDTVAQISFIKRAQKLGFMLGEVLDLLAIQANPNGSCADVKAKALDKIVDIEEKIRKLQHIRTTLSMLAKSCTGTAAVSECPIMLALQRQ